MVRKHTIGEGKLKKQDKKGKETNIDAADDNT
jgi:hypothetical protein